ncbi:unnamed protein product [Ixodes pacificus]
MSHISDGASTRISTIIHIFYEPYFYLQAQCNVLVYSSNYETKHRNLTYKQIRLEISPKTSLDCANEQRSFTDIDLTEMPHITVIFLQNQACCMYVHYLDACLTFMFLPSKGVHMKPSRKSILKRNI